MLWYYNFNEIVGNSNIEVGTGGIYIIFGTYTCFTALIGSLSTWSGDLIASLDPFAAALSIFGGNGKLSLFPLKTTIFVYYFKGATNCRMPTVYII